MLSQFFADETEWGRILATVRRCLSYLGRYAVKSLLTVRFLAPLRRCTHVLDTTILWSSRFLSWGAFTLLASATFLNQFGLWNGITARLRDLFLTLGAAWISLWTLRAGALRPLTLCRFLALSLSLVDLFKEGVGHGLLCRDSLLRLKLEESTDQIYCLVWGLINKHLSEEVWQGWMLIDRFFPERVDILHLILSRASFCSKNQCELVDVALALEQGEAPRGERFVGWLCGRPGQFLLLRLLQRLAIGSFLEQLGVNALMITSSEKLGEHAACCPKIDLNTVISIAVEKLRRSIISSRDVGHTATW